MSRTVVVLLQGDPGTMKSLVATLCDSCSIHVVNSFSELRLSIAKHRAEAAVLDMEKMQLSDIEALAREFPQTRLICNHRLADEVIWTVALNAGATDVFPSYDTRGILTAAIHDNSRSRSVAA